MSQTLVYRTAVEQKRPANVNPRILLLALGMFALGTDAFVVAGVLPVIAKETGVTEGVAGQLITVFSLTYALGAPLLAGVIGRWSPNRVLVGALGLFCLVNVASALSPSFLTLLLTRILAGCFAASFAPLAYTVGVSLAPSEKRGQALGLVALGLTVATVLGSPLGTWVGEHAGWRLSFAVVAGLAGIAFLMLLLVGLPKTVAPATIPLKTRLAPIVQPRVVLALLPALLWNLGVYIIYAYIAPLLQQNMHIVDISGLLIVFGLGVLIGNRSGGMLADRFGPNRPMLVSIVALIILEAALSLATSALPSALPILIFWGMMGSNVFTPQQYRLLNLAPEHANVILALNNSTFYLGAAGGAALGGVALRFVPATHFGWLGASCTLLALAFFALSLRLSGRKRDTSEKMEDREKVLVAPE